MCWLFPAINGLFDGARLAQLLPAATARATVACHFGRVAPQPDTGNQTHTTKSLAGLFGPSHIHVQFGWTVQ